MLNVVHKDQSRRFESVDQILCQLDTANHAVRLSPPMTINNSDRGLLRHAERTGGTLYMAIHPTARQLLFATSQEALTELVAILFEEV